MAESNRKAEVIDPSLKKAEKSAAQKVLAKHLYNQGLTNKEIAAELGTHEGTVRKWFREAKLPSGVARKLCVQQNRKPAAVVAPAVTAELVELNPTQQVSPADQYQQYVASEGMRILQDALPSLRGPRTVKELGELDQIIRRNLGLNAKSGGGSGGRLAIDISILSGKHNPNKNIIDVESDEYQDTDS